MSRLDLLAAIHAGDMLALTWEAHVADRPVSWLKDRP